MSQGSNVASTSSYVFPPAPAPPAGPPVDPIAGETDSGIPSVAAADNDDASASMPPVVFHNDARNPKFFEMHQQQLEARRAHAEVQKAKLSAVRLSKKDAKGISGGRLKRYMCTWPDCGKAYTRPTRLAEHQRIHTGERPYPCLYCAATFSRESHRKAHTRIHRDDSERNCYCPIEGCGMVFWTNQHLKKHLEGKHGDPKPPKYFCTQCDEGFRQRKPLRMHTMEVHGPPNAKPYPCMHPGCDRTFNQFAHVRSHMKTHDLSRYACIHPDCAGLGDEANQFGTWSALQKHTKALHPPVCPHEECHGRTFTTRRGLRYHLDSHTRKQQRAEAQKARDALNEVIMGRPGEDVPEDEHDGPFASVPMARPKRPASLAGGAGSPKTRKKAKASYAEDSDDDGPTFDDLYGDDAGFSPAAPDEDDEDDDFRSDMGDSDDGVEEGVVWLAQQDAERDDRMREDFRHGGKRKRKVLREADGFPPLLLPIPPPPLARRETASPPLERLPTPPPNILGQPLVITDQPLQQSVYLDMVTGANYSPATSVPPPPVPPAASTSSAAAPAAPSQDETAEGAGNPVRPTLVRKFPCPYPAILSMPHKNLRNQNAQDQKKRKRQRARFPFMTPLPEGMEPIEGGEFEESDPEDGDGLCKFWFKRVYDVERHLRSKHKTELEGGRTALNYWYATGGSAGTRTE